MEEPTVDDVLAGIISINGVRCRAIFDTGASHSFISRSFAMTHELRVLKYKGFTTMQVLEHSFVVTEYSLACLVRIGDWIMKVNFLVLRWLGYFDVVLGMDRLSKYYATIDCESRVITFRDPEQKEFIYKGCRSSLFAMTVSTSRAKKLINGGCVAYLATIVEEQTEHPALESIPVAREYPDVFPVELPGMSENREIVLIIYLVPGMAPISKAPYRMTPAELKKLKAQLQDLLDKGLHQAKCISLGGPGAIREEERRVSTLVCGLSGAQQSDYQEKISITKD